MVHFNQAWSERRKDLLDDFNDSSIKYFQIYQSFGISSSSINGLQALFLSQINNSKFFLPFYQKEGSNEVLSQTWSSSGTSRNSSIVVQPLLSLQDLRGIWYEDQIDQSELVYTLFRSQSLTAKCNMAANSSGTAPSAQTKSNPPSKEKETLLAVLQFLKKKNLSVSFINILLKEWV